MLSQQWPLLWSHLDECSVEKQERFGGTGERKDSLGESGLPEAAKRTCCLSRDVKDRQNVFVEWIRGGELN